MGLRPDRLAATAPSLTRAESTQLPPVAGSLACRRSFCEKVSHTAMLSIDATRILLGVLLLAFGRRLFWLFVGAVGFVGAIQFANKFLQGQPDETVVIFALIVGFVGAIMAITLRKIALGAAGFLVGGYLLMSLLAATGQEHHVALAVGRGGAEVAPWLAFLVGGLVGAVLMNALFVWTLIVLSSMSGAALICESLRLGSQAGSIIFTILVFVGVLAQSGLMRRTTRPAG